MGGRDKPVWVWGDLVDGRFEGRAVANGGEGAWNRYNFWAPEVLVEGGKYWLYYTAKSRKDEKNHTNRLGVAVSERPGGPFEDRGVVIEHAALDGSLFRDADGQLWLYYVTEHGNARGLAAGKIWVDRLIDPMTVADEGRCLIDRHEWQEGPVVLRLADGRYNLSFSLGGWTGSSYRVGQALGERPDGPFEESEELIMETTEAVIGPGHHNFFVGPDGERWLIYHGWDVEQTARYPRLDRMEVGADGTIRSEAPTSGRQRWEWGEV